MKNIIRVGALTAVSALVLAACASAPEEEPAASSSATAGGETPVETVDYRPCMVSDAGGFDDKSFNQAGYEGLVSISEELGLEYNTVESQDGNEYGPNIDALVADGCDLIVTVGFLLGDATAAAAAANPDTNFAMIDNAFDEPVDNVKPILFSTNEAAFLAGYAAAATTATGTVATFGGINIPPVTVFMDGFYRGVNYFNETTGGDVTVLGWDGTDGSFTGDFEDATKGQNLTQGFIDQGADIILPVAGPVGLGAAAAAQAAGDTWIIGVDSDWTLTAPEYSDIILTSIMKNMGPAVHDVVNEAAVGAGFSAEAYFGTLENEGVGLGTTASVVSEDVLAELETITAGIIDGSIATS
ncbi:membrane lipoprotein TmpC [Demequina sediminis]|uniref:Membrane lipoprotein TmpC n=1 Tax=Demequina sediminis TaxID=1930058 RepID=A0ABP9WDV8_9MICO|nr:BMP family ABC transporter substrate-binding protein [Demequina sediminis]BDZ61790.1 BMP family ABC transporter substrate-binding protein [Demequina sediminis]